MTKIEHDLFDLWVDGGLSQPSLKALENRRHLNTNMETKATQTHTEIHKAKKM